MGAPPDSDREAILGFDCVHRVAQSYLGPLWIATDTRDDRAALRLLRSLALPAGTSEEARRRLARVGQMATGLSHPHVLQVMEVLADGERLAMVYEHAEAEPLRSLQSWANLRGLSFPVGVALRITSDLLLGLAAAHELEAREPDLCASGGLSPDSVLVARDGVTRLCDPLIASGAALIEGVGFNTAKLAYAAPEQVRATAPPTPQADLFTCAALLWELLASRRLLAGSRPAIERKLLDHQLPSLKASLKPAQKVSDELIALVERTLAAEPAERPASAAELARQLGECGHELAPTSEVAAFVGKLSGPRFDRRTAAIRSRSSASFALDELKLPLEVPSSAREPAAALAGAAPISDIETPRAAGSSAQPPSVASPPSVPRPAPSSPTAAAAPEPPSAPQSAPFAPEHVAPSASFETPEPPRIELPSISSPFTRAPFAPAPVEPPSLGFAAPPADGAKAPALWQQMVTPTTPPVTAPRDMAPFGSRTITGLGGSSQPAGASDATPSADDAELDDVEPISPPLAPPVAAPSPFAAGALPALTSTAFDAGAPPDAPLPFEHLLARSKRGRSERASVEPGSQSWFELHAPPRSSAGGGGFLSRHKLGVSLALLVSFASGAWLLLGRSSSTPVAAIAERPTPTEPAPPASGPEPPSGVAPAPPTTPPTALDASAPPAVEVPTPPGSADAPARAVAADFAAAKLDDSQLVVLFALEGRTTLPSCAERLGDDVRRYSGNDLRRSGLQIKAARRQLARGDALAAHELACSAVAHNPRNPAAQRTLADIALQLGDAAQAKLAVDKAIARAPKDKGLQAMRGDVLSLMGDIAGARSIWLRNASPPTGSKAARTKRLVAAYRKAGEKALASSSWAEAVVYFRRAVILTHGSLAPSIRLSEALLSLDHSRAALVWAERAAQASPRDAAVQLLFGDALYESGQSEKARSAWQAALDLQPGNRVAARRLKEGKP